MRKIIMLFVLSLSLSACSSGRHSYSYDSYSPPIKYKVPEKIAPVKSNTEVDENEYYKEKTKKLLKKIRKK
jgi:hypothetical protein